MTEVNGILRTHVYSSNPHFDSDFTPLEITIPCSNPDEFVRNPNDKSQNGKFDITQCFKNFGKGLISPLKAVVDHPLMTIGVISAAAGACVLVPVLAPVLAIGFAGLSLYDAGKGTVEAYKHYKNGEYDEAEKSFNKIGEGTIGTVLSVLGVRQCAGIAKEAKLMNELNVNTLNSTQKSEIAAQVQNMTRTESLKEIGSLFTSTDGLKAAAKQFTPSAIKQRAVDAYEFLFTKVDKVKTERMKFEETSEGKRRAALTTEEIDKEVQTLAKEAFDEYGIPEELRPQVEVVCEESNLGGGYLPNEHRIKINEILYKKGACDLPSTVKHEATHAKEAILRQRLPEEEKQKIIIEYLSDKIQNGDKENVIVGQNPFTGTESIKPPKLNQQMKNDFTKLAQDKLYQDKGYTQEEYTDMVRPLVESNPEFAKEYESMEKAIEIMTDYAKSHNQRYKLAYKSVQGFNTSNIDTSLLTELSEEERLLAVQSIKNSIDCFEDNCLISGGILVSGAGNEAKFNQYQFTPEEVLAETQGAKSELSKLEKQLETLRSNPDYDIAEEARLLDQIKVNQLTIEYRTKGEEMYKLYTESINHPEDTKLAEQVKAMQEEVTGIKNQIEEIIKVNKWEGYMEALDYQIHQVRPDLGATIHIPYATPVAAEITSNNS